LRGHLPVTVGGDKPRFGPKKVQVVLANPPPQGKSQGDKEEGLAPPRVGIKNGDKNGVCWSMNHNGGGECHSGVEMVEETRPVGGGKSWTTDLLRLFLLLEEQCVGCSKRIWAWRGKPVKMAMSKEEKTLEGWCGRIYQQAPKQTSCNMHSSP
jgi:hypothetical protein